MNDEKPKITRTRPPAFAAEMSRAQIDGLEEFARHPSKTIDECHAWLADAQVRASRSAVGRWLQDFRLEEKTSRAAEVARSYLASAADADPNAITRASLKKFNELVFETLAGGDQLDSLDLAGSPAAMKTGLDAEKLIEATRNEFAKLKTAAGQSKAITPEMIDAASRAVFG